MFEWLGAYNEFLFGSTLITILLVLSVALLFWCGLFSLATGGFTAIGAYTTALLVTKAGWPTPVGLVAAPVVAAVGSLLIGTPILRLKGIYLALGTLALSQAIILGISNFSFTNGTRGVLGIPLRVTTTELFVLTLAVVALFELVHRSHFGRAMHAIRLDERTAEGLGINVFRYRLVVFALSGALSGFAGALEAHTTGVISPDQYGFSFLLVLFTYALVGGSAHWIGPVIATVGLVVLEHQLNFAGSTWENFLYGALLVVVMVLVPGGLTDRSIRVRAGLVGRAAVSRLRPSTARR